MHTTIRKRLAKSSFFLMLCLLIPAFSTLAAADPVTIDLTGPVDTSTNPVVGNVFVGPYAGTIDGSPVELVCDDYDHNVTVGEVWQANVSTFADLTHTRFWNAADATQSLKNYEMAAWLTAQIFMNSQSVWGDISFAIWRIFSADAPNVGNSSYWLNLAANQDYSHYDFSAFRIYTPSNPTSPQEYIVVTPEPASVLLLGTGLLGGFLRKRYSKKMQQKFLSSREGSR